ncbi:MAG: hypothetical protein A2268_00745 [Candidatus Raymondbacteria bacterium RifOxyA12_full_50_37]|uniref:ATP-grasp domain-containing protein n=1 Tax=Candidatus Raymondbacteria bacterium RIFOXYD12_FULL_49_13 TaxID=1817890 RepID=A0A1F7F1X1_UNCRA|nr:MAG: hypothetical protein A2268_00745 [Candidatus Raymondbacteria bacterium RifOxyA12_full_50_37]OGJ90057.1 MAG: hypothetical protein A2248_19075 [Candidatus Raymondbacteria bacterium RIFOXYA2_FULL_49_16]OGJ92874.1 MAG: hypothetical protein A2487_09640 [Candidatus Raymondbacteria bacterium RifOxyC12_full_50_8]OGJ96698.1 MAG: hypothetical protein A2350_01930 [Candidatus Raymondbacteria bacterium RifOxyB12_full_50_8]OGJ96741.1 MAG: hypothetical protein A2453_06200 [Candidatus Raymondbacteria b
MKRLSPLTVILTGAGAPGWPDICRSLVENNERTIDIVAVDMDRDVAGYRLVKKHAVVPAGVSPAYIPAMVCLVKKFKAHAIVPLTDPELPALASAASLFKKMGVVLPVARPSAIAIAADKIRTHEFLTNRHRAIPAYRIARTSVEFSVAIAALGYPKTKVCFKPGIAHGSRGFRILDPQATEAATLFAEKAENTRYAMTGERAREILDNCASFPSLLVTEYLPGKEYSVDLLVRKRSVAAVVCRERTRIRFGLTYQGRVIADPKLERLAVDIALRIGLTFNANIQFKKDAAGTYRLLEINPRTSGTIALCRAAGVNLPYLGLKLALGERITAQKPVPGTRNYRYWTHVFT